MWRILLVGSICIVVSVPVRAETLGFGSRAGMDATVVRKDGLDTDRAVIITRHTRENAEAFCVDYEQKVTPRCVSEQLGLRLNDRIVGNCRTGEFIDFSGAHYRFEGELPHDAAQPDDPIASLLVPKYAVRDLATAELANGSEASAYPTNMRLFRALCPREAPVSDR